jgi:hypothetical protein
MDAQMALTIYRFFLISLSALMSASCSSGGGTVSLLKIEWTSPSERANSTALQISEIQGYRIYYSKSKGSYLREDSIDVIGNGSVQQFSVPTTTIPSGTYYIVMTATDTDGRESQYSDPALEVKM